jgi:hypothetical protein
VDPIALRQDSAGTITLDPNYVELNNPGYGAHMLIETIGGVSNIGHWTDNRAWVRWTFSVSKPGTFTVSMDIAGDGETAFEWGVDGAMQKAATQSSGGFSGFKQVELGTVTIDKPGTHHLAIKPAKSGWKPINLRAVTLKPES